LLKNYVKKEDEKETKKIQSKTITPKKGYECGDDSVSARFNVDNKE